MHEIVKVNLDNEMDLILAHKRTIKLAELCGLSISSQTTFATAVSEIARCAISQGSRSHLVLGINMLSAGKKEIRASIFDEVDLNTGNSDAFSYAKRLMGNLTSLISGDFFETRLNQLINFSGTISDIKIQTFKDYFKNEPPISPYDEIRKKNIQLMDLAKKLEEREMQYKVLTDTLPLMMFAINTHGEVIYANKWLKDFVSQSPSNLTTSTWQAMVHADDGREIWKEWDKSQLEKTPFRAQGRLRDKDESYIWHLITIVPLKNEKDVITSWIGFFVDIHSQKLVEETLKDNKELKAAQEELLKYHQQLEQKISELNASNQNLEQFAFIASHDLQEPLRKIMIFSNLLQTDLELTEKQARQFGKIQSSSERMSTLIREVLNYSKLSPQEIFVDTDLQQIANNVLQDLELIIEESGAKIMLSGLRIVSAIPLQMTQLFSNLIHNAIKFNENKPVISISCKTLTQQEVKDRKELDNSKEYYLLKFTDNGIGFDPQYANKIFIIFQRLQALESKGTGIGLALCKRIAENHGGFMNAESEPGKGALFNVFLPIPGAGKEKE